MIKKAQKIRKKKGARFAYTLWLGFFTEQKCPLATLVSKFTILGAALPHPWDGESGRVIKLC